MNLSVWESHDTVWPLDKGEVLCKQILKHFSYLNIFVVKSHLVLLSAMSNELSFCLFMRHSNGYLWARCHVLWLDLWSWPWLHIYTGMLNDSLSHCQYPTCTWILCLLRSERLIQSSCSAQSISTCVCSKWVPVQTVGVSLLPFKSHSICYLSCTQTCLPSPPFRCLFTGVREVQRIVCWRLIIHYWVSGTQIKEEWRKGVGYHFGKLQGGSVGYSVRTCQSFHGNEWHHRTNPSFSQMGL